VLAFGAVSPVLRASIGTVAGVMSLVLILRRRVHSAPPPALVALWGLALVGLVLSGLPLFPLGDAARDLLQPGYADVLSEVGALAAGEWRPLALRPRGALFSWVYTSHMLLVTAAIALSVTAPRQASRVGQILVAVAIGVLMLDVLQRSTGATSVGWISGVGVGRPFFGSFVNPNHGGLLCGALAPLAGALALHSRRHRSLRMVAAGVLVVGAVASGSRGAVVACGVGWMVFAVLDGRGGLAIAAWGGLAATLTGLALFGPETLFSFLTRFVDPSMVRGADLYSNRPQVWHDAATLLQNAPILGVGGDGFIDAYKGVKVSPRFALASQAHCDPLQLAVEHGLPSLLVWLSGAGVVGGAAVRACRGAEPGIRTLLAGYLGVAGALAAFSLFDFPMRIGALVFVGAIVAGVLIGLSHRYRPSASPRVLSMASASVLVVTGIGFGLLGVAGWGGSSAFGEDVRSFEAATAALETGDLDTAETLFSVALRQRPMNQGALLQLARVARASGDEDAAVARLQLAARVYPTYPFTWLSLARVQRSRGNRHEALAAYRELIALNHPNEQPKPWLDEAFSYAGDFETLIGTLLLDRPDRYCPAAQWLEQSGDRDGGELLYRFGAERSVSCSASLGWRMVSWGRPDEALAWIASLPSTCLTERTRAYALLGLDRDEEALRAAERGLQRCGGGDRSARLGLARARLRVGDMRAMGMLEGLLDDGDEPTVRRLLFRGYLDLGRTELALEQALALSRQGHASPEELAWLKRFAAGTR
jgi:tetratricopeptide (TPR) repeat protein